MPKSSSPEQDPPLYVRWTPDNCPYALELRLEVIARLRGILDAFEASGAETGGVFTGAFPSPDSPTLRLDDVILVPANADGRPLGTQVEFPADAEHLRLIAEIAAQTRQSGLPVIGSFRSHRREESLAASEFDAAMLSRLFPEGLYAFLLIGPQIPRQATFYLAVSGQLPEMPSVPYFVLDEASFRSLPELPAEATEDVRNFGIGRGSGGRNPTPWPAIASLALLVILTAFWIFSDNIAQWFRPDSNQIDLSVTSAGGNLKITWDHAAPPVTKALGATIVIMDGASHREVRLDSDDLRLGQIAYERLTGKVYVVMRLDAPGVRLPPQTFDWSGN